MRSRPRLGRVAPLPLGDQPIVLAALTTDSAKLFCWRACSTCIDVMTRMNESLAMAW